MTAGRDYTIIADGGLKGAHVQHVNSHTPFVRIAGADLRKIGPSDTAILRRLMQTHAVLVFPGQALTPRQEVDFNTLFKYHDDDDDETGHGFGFSAGHHGAHDGCIPACRSVQVQGNVMVRNHYGIDGLQLKMAITYENEGFHSDGIHDEADFAKALQKHTFPALTSMYCIRAPEIGGETRFACTRAPFAALSEQQKGLLRRLRVHYMNKKFLTLRGQPVMEAGCRQLGPREHDSKLLSEGFEDLGAAEEAENGPVHPLVRRHPGTGDESMFLSTAAACFVEAPKTTSEPAVHLGWSDSVDLIHSMVSEACSEPKAYAHIWQKDDFVIWDNRLTLHSAPKLQNTVGERLFHRVRLTGSKESNVDCIETWEAVRRSRGLTSKL